MSWLIRLKLHSCSRQKGSETKQLHAGHGDQPGASRALKCFPSSLHVELPGSSSLRWTYCRVSVLQGFTGAPCWAPNPVLPGSAQSQATLPQVAPPNPGVPSKSSRSLPYSLPANRDPGQSEPHLTHGSVGTRIHQSLYLSVGATMGLGTSLLSRNLFYKPPVTLG